MDLDPLALAEQLRNPSGSGGKELGKVMAQYNAEPNAWVVSMLHLQPKDHVLEIGFGPGEAIAEVVRLTPNGYIAGIDHSETMLKVAEDRNHRAVMQEHVELMLGEAESLPYEDESFDKVFSVNVMHFWNDPLLCLREIHRVLKPGGRMVHYLTSPATWPPGIDQTGVFRAYTPEEMVALLTEAGFKNAHSERKTFGGQWEGMAAVGERDT